MTYGILSKRQLECLSRAVKGRNVHDLGCGPWFPHSAMLLEAGAKRVTGVDKEPRERALLDNERYRKASFDRYYPKEIDIAFLSWPTSNPTPGLVKLVSQAETVIYLGKNTDGSICGDKELLEQLLSRRLVAHQPEFTNTLLIASRLLAKKRKPTPEERSWGFRFDPQRLYEIFPYIE